MRRKTGIARIDEFKSALVGADEVGWGAMAGPLVVCAVAAPASWDDPRVTDSKALTPKRREVLYNEFIEDDRFVVSMVDLSSQEVDQMTPAKARIHAFEEAVRGTFWRLSHTPLVVLDGNLKTSLENVLSLPKADLKVPEVGLASILAKVYRDRIMVKHGAQYPGYGFERHVGYVTKEHKAALEKLGPCPIHRRSYEPVKSIVRKQQPPPADMWDGFDDA